MQHADKQMEKVLPFYLVTDVSYSMEDPASADGSVRKIDAVNDIVPMLKVSLMENRILADKVRFSLIDFSDVANVVLPMMDLQDLPESDIPVLTTRGGTSYGAAFLRIKEQIEIDRAMLRGDSLDVYRPAVFFVSDGEPTDGSAWKMPFEDLVEAQWYPNFIPFGVQGASPDVLRTLAFPVGNADSKKNMVCYMASDGATPAKTIAAIAPILIKSMTLSLGQVPVGGAGESADPVDVFELPDPEDLPEGVEQLDDDDFMA